MKAFKTLTSRTVPLQMDDVDTDQIIPARFLKATTREGFGENLFRDWRFESDNSIKAEFILNNPVYKGDILITGSNFGCGSSREHAAWAIYDFGFRVVISSFFADIFKNNALNNGLLPIQLDIEIVNDLLASSSKNPELTLSVDLEKQVVTRNDSGEIYSFEINPYKKLCLVNGYDDLDYLISLKDKTTSYSNAISDWRVLTRP